jgi:UDP-N-acetylmuramoyl-L-alanyl-D-glutamate--2,6-diaminopimelate ligase
MKLSQLIDGVAVAKMFQTVYGAMVQTHDVEIRTIRYDSRKAEAGDLFVAIRGLQSDGHRFVHEVIRKKVKAIVVEDDAVVPDSLCMHEGVVKIVVSDTRRALSRMSANFFGHPSRECMVIGVTGTNGKTTTTYLLASIAEAAGGKAGLIGTIEYRIGDKVITATHTTPESYELQRLLRQMVDAGCTAIVMEVSSHALEQHRVDDVRFASAVFTNLTQDHLDYHRTMEEYFAAKRRLFLMLDGAGSAITNIDSEHGRAMVEGCRGTVTTYGVSREADVAARDIRATMRGTSFRVTIGGDEQEIDSPLVGKFNVSNMLAAYACAYAVRFEKSVIKAGIERVSGIRGRFETIESPRGWIAVVDYSHTPDALENVLRAVREVKAPHARVTTVFGCGGDRDKVKRPLMGRIAQTLSERIVVTSDNPRTEDPEAIIDEIMKGVDTTGDVQREPDRRRAIEAALGKADHDDVILIAGKGHETYQVLGDRRIHFNDREIVEEWIAAQ